MRRYFAYGSNMWLAQMERRCPGSRCVGRGVLEDHRWIITSRGYASVIRSAGDHVLGSVFDIDEEHERALDVFENVAGGSYTKVDLQIRRGDALEECLVYVDPREDEGLPPPEYVARILNGARDAGLPDEYIARYLMRFLSSS